MKDEAKTAEKKMRENQKGRDSTVGREKEEEKREKEKGKRKGGEKGGEKGGAVAIVLQMWEARKRLSDRKDLLHTVTD